MEEITLCELINNDKYKSFVTPGDKKYFNEHGYLKEIGRNVKKIKRKYKYVEVIGTGKDVVLKLDDKDPNAIVDRRSISNTKELTIMLSNNFKNKYNGHMLGSRHKAKEWLMITGFRRPYENINELRQEIRESFGGNYYSDYDKRPVDINNYYEVGYANGFIACVKAMPKDDRKMYIESIKEVYNKNKDEGKECKTFEYVLRLYNDEFKTIEI